MQGEALAPRDLVVWLPPDHEAASDRRYPVLYMFDGQNLFDPATSSFGADWAIDEAVDSPVRAGTIPPLIIVGMHSTAARTEEYLPRAKSSAHMAFVLRTVKPLIDAMYRGKSDAASTWVGGSSAGGIAAFMLVWEHPGVFSRALAFSPAFQAPAGMSMRFDHVRNVKASAQPPGDARSTSTSAASGSRANSARA